MVNIVLNDDSNVYPWFKDGKDYVRGVAFIEGKMLCDYELLSEIRKIVFDENYSNLKNLDGFYVGIITIEGSTFIVSDKIRSFPIFYSLNNDTPLLCENLSTLSDYVTLNREMIEDFEGELSAFPLNHTIMKNVFQTRAHSVLKYSDSGFSIIDYSPIATYTNDTHPANESELWSAYESSFNQMLKYTGAKQLVIPLSGGCDSRIILQTLSRIGYKNIITYTYGRKSSKEVQIARRLASDFGVKWIFIEYNNKRWRKLVSEGILEKYCLANRQGGAVPHVQDLLAVYELKKRHLVDDDAVFLPGHGGGVVDGGDLPLSKFFECKSYSGEYIGHVLFSRVFRSIPDSRYEELKTKGYLDSCSDQSDRVSALNHYFDKYICDRPSKYIGNSVRVFEFFGYEWYMPLWSNELLEYWSTVPIDDKADKRFMLQCLYSEVPTDHGVSFARKAIHKIPTFNPFRSFLRMIKAVKYYFTSPNAIEGCFSFKQYLDELLRQHGSFSIVHLILQYYVRVLQQQ